MHKTSSSTRKARIGIRELRGNLSGYVRAAHAGQIIEVTSHDEVLAELRPAATAKDARRRPGTLKGKIQIAADFDRTPNEVIEAFEG